MMDDYDDELSDIDEDIDDDGGLELESDPMFGDEPSPSMKISRTASFEVLPQEAITNNSKKMIDEVVQVCGIPTEAAAAALLRYYKWNKEKLIEGYLDDPKKTCTAAGMSTLELERPVKNPTAVHTCLICLEDLPDAETFALSCGHRYCKDCWQGYLNVKIGDGPSCIYSRCPSPKCNAIVHEQAFKQLTPDTTYQRYIKYMFRSFVDDNPHVKWCPAPGCTNAIRCERTGRRPPVLCKCGFAFCFRCADSDIGDHQPVDCERLDKWLQKASDESENVKWLKANTKNCPKCRSPIEKNGGCMHMTCKTSSCGYEFCWLCRGPWNEHGTNTGGYYQCNKYDASDAKKDDDKAQGVKSELETYMFYYHRYESHKNAGKIADQQRSECQKREMQILDTFDVRSQDTKFLMEATEQLIANRRVLQYSYVMGYYLDKSKLSEKNLFEDLQEQLEKFTDTLSGLYEESIESIENYHNFMAWKENVTNYTRVTQRFLQNYLDGTSEGLTFNSS